MKHQLTRLAAMLATALFAAAGTAQAPVSPPQRILRGAEIPMTKATMLLYSELASDRSQDAPAFRALTGFDRPTIDKYLAYVTAAVESIHDSENEQRVKLLCEKRNAITSGEQLTAALVQIDANVEAAQVKIIEGSQAVLGVDGKRQVDSYVLGTRDGLVIAEVDSRKVVQFGMDTGLSVSGIVAKLCPDR